MLTVNIHEDKTHLSRLVERRPRRTLRHRQREIADRYVEGLRKAGLPEE
jgi:hypothetical protein